MTTAPTRTPAASVPSGSGPTNADEAAAAGFTLAGFLAFGPGGALVAAIAVGIQRAFEKSGWQRPSLPSWLAEGEVLSPEELELRRVAAVAAAKEHLERTRERATVRRAARKQHQENLQEWLKQNREGDKPGRPEEIRNPWEFLKDSLAASKSWYTLFDDKLARGNVKVTGTYPKIAEFFQDLWNFLTGFVEGVTEEWRRQQEQRKVTSTTEDGPKTGPDPELTAGNEQPSTDQGPDPEPEPGPAAGSGPDPEPGPTPLPGPTSGTLPNATGPEISAGPAGPAGPASEPVEGDVMTADGATALPASNNRPAAHMGPQGATNLDLIDEALAPALPCLNGVTSGLATLKMKAAAIKARARYLADLAALEGAPQIVWEMLAQADAMVVLLELGIQQLELRTEQAYELTHQAVYGMEPAHEDQEVIRGEQASGDMLNRASY